MYFTFFSIYIRAEITFFRRCGFYKLGGRTGLQPQLAVAEISNNSKISDTTVGAFVPFLMGFLQT